jgi:signal transduction histidine kinase
VHPMIRDEIHNISREALVNVFRHSRAKRIEVDVGYKASHLRVVIRDDGGAIGPHAFQPGREGLFGLSGMRERAERIGARLSWTLSIPGL